MEAPHKIWHQSAEQFLRKRNLKMLNLSDPGLVDYNRKSVGYNWISINRAQNVYFDYWVKVKHMYLPAPLSSEVSSLHQTL